MATVFAIDGRRLHTDGLMLHDPKDEPVSAEFYALLKPDLRVVF